ncbi:hypothetical protein KXD93_10055 [Mucilaginibacter sp. BJC16-A38]|uniref:hypothetical protein n=1 Tax=Mucilaginibacter phenanthrenivorans TaxID=1234842 RepID=UPI00215736ED|nr:hypothetical protein [Mucilaginibacter phenanthrenivorans]MCR8557987.1 hypothetical protein [Mucilaginibacter phenanthrenivorans]
MEKLSRFKTITLFLNASASKLANKGRYKDAFYDTTESTTIFLLWCLEFSIFKLLTLHTGRLDSTSKAILILAPIVIHLGIAYLCSGDLKLIEADYPQYYGRYSYIVYCILSIAAVIYTLYYFLWAF